MTEDQLNNIIQYLEDREIECTPIGNDKKDLFVDIEVDGDIRLKISFPEGFPYVFPKIEILEEFYKKYDPLPHINYDRTICTFDTSISYPNYMEPEKLTYETICQAKKILIEGIENHNKSDFLDEFNSYWDFRVDVIKIWLLEYPSKESQLLKYYVSTSKQICYVLSESSAQQEFVKIQCKGENVIFEECIYIQLHDTWYPPFPKNNKDIYCKIREDKNAFEAYRMFLLNRSNRLSLIILSIDVGTEKIFFSFAHKLIETNTNGFRKGKINPDWFYTKLKGKIDIIKFHVDVLDRIKITKRGGEGVIRNKIVSITGCGSVGSQLVQGLVDIGLTHLTLIDKECLSIENTPRHMCGASYVGKFKTDAIKELLIQHYSYLEIYSIHKNIFDVIKEEFSIFNNSDYNFIVVGNVPIEIKFIELFKERKITRPVIIIWVEPYIIGGHAIVIRSKDFEIETIYDENSNFKYRVLENGSKYLELDVGCGSTYVPYTGFEVKFFLCNFIDFFQKEVLNKDSKKNLLFSWGGRLSKARRENIEITDFWLGKKDREVRVLEL